MAEKKKTTSKTTSSRSKGKSTSSKSRSSSAKADTRSKQQAESAELPSLGGGFWGVVLLALGVFMIISAFSEDGKYTGYPAFDSPNQ